MFEDILDYLKSSLPQKIKDGGFSNYEIFGKEAETPISDTIEEYLKLKNLTFEARRAKTKNDFPDLEIEIDGVKYALEHKAGIYNNKGEIKNTAANDMGTLNAYPEKIKKYKDNIYCTFVKYSVLEDDTISVEDIYFDKIYTFIGKGTGFATQLQYREKDGNLRPKNWKEMSDEVIHFKTLSEFEKALRDTAAYRSERIIIKHVDFLGSAALRRVKAYIDEKLK